MHRIRVLAALAVAFASLCLGACREKQFEGRPTFAFVTNMPHEFWEMAHAGVMQAGRDLEVNVEFHQPNGKLEGQMQKLEDVLSTGVDGIAVSVLQPDAQTPLLDEIAAKVPLVTHDADAPASKRRCFIGVDNYRSGRMLGALVRERMADGGKLAIFVGNLTQANARDRRQGVLDVLLGRAGRPETDDPKDGPLTGGGFEILGTYLDDGEAPKAKERVEDVLSLHADLDGVIGLFQHNAPQALAALSDAGRLGEVKVFSFDEHANTLAAIEAGTCEGTVVQDPYAYGYKAIETLAAIHDGKPDAVPAGGVIDISPVLVTQENLAPFREELAKKAAILRDK